MKVTPSKAKDIQNLNRITEIQAIKKVVKPSVPTDQILGEEAAESALVENNEPSILMPFKDLNDSKIVKCMRNEFGKHVIPLPLVGHFLNFIGNAILMYIFNLFSTTEKQTRIFYPMHKVENI